MSSQMSQMSQFEPLDVKFKALLDPIKDLAANWDIDIADSLTDYLEELDGLRLSLDGQKNLNFAAAGLLIQGSTAVYSKKVEFLHQLVLQSLDQITSSKSTSSNGHGKNKNNTSSSLLDDERLLFGTDPSFLLLDDAVEEGSNINLPDIPNAMGSKERRRSSARHSLSGDFSRASMVLMHSVLQEDHGGSSLRMSSCQIDSSGALVIGGLNPERSFLNRSVDLNISSDPFNGAGPGPYPSFMEPADDDEDRVRDREQGGDWGDDGDNNDFSLIGDEDCQPDHNNSSDPTSGKNLPGNGMRSSDLEANLRDANRAAARAKEKERNVLSLMDPHSVTTGSKALKKGRSNKIPRGTSFLSEIGNIISVKPLISFDIMDFHSNTTSTSNFELDSELNLNFDYCSGKKIPLNNLINAMFRPQLKKLNRDIRLNNLKLNNKRKENIKNDNFYLYGNANNDIDDDNRGARGAEEDRDGMSDGEDNGGMGEFWDNDNDNDNDVDNNNEFNNDNLKNRVPNISDENILSGEHGSAFRGQNKSPGVCSGTDMYNPFEDGDDSEQLMRRVDLALSDTMNDTQAGTYESVCRRHIQSFMEGAELYARETQLSKRVADWTSRLEPILRAQELAPEYDIHTYSDLVLTQVGSVPAMDLERRFQVLGLNSDENTGGVEEVRLTACREVIQTDRTIVDFQEIVGYRGQTKEPGQGQGQGWDQDHVGMGAGTGVGVGVGGSSAEVCRVFLACLMLANSGNLDLIPPLPVVEKKTLKSAQNDKFKDMEKGKDTGRDVFRSAKKEKYFSHNNNNQKMSFRVRLLDSKRNLDVEGFRAPSIDGKC